MGSQNIGYDLNGNLTSDSRFAFAYDPENHLISAAKSGTVVTYAYDPMGRRTAKSVNDTTTYFLSSGDDEIAEYDGSGALMRRFVPGPGVDQPLAMVTATGEKTFFHQDKLGSVIAMSKSSGEIAEGPYTYDSFGNCVASGLACEQTGSGVPYRYTGRRLDPETGLYYYRARYYSSAIGRFLQTDPIGYKDDINWYTYVGNDPTDKTDPSGLQTFPYAPGNGPAAEAEAIRNCNGNEACAQEVIRQNREQYPIAAEAGAWNLAGEGAGALIGWGARGIMAARAAQFTARAATADRVVNYLLNAAHAGGGAEKAAWFRGALGFTRENAGGLIKQFKFDANSAVLQKTTQYGEVFTQETRLVGANGKEGMVTAVWQVDNAGASKGVARLITAKNFRVIDP